MWRIFRLRQAQLPCQGTLSQMPKNRRKDGSKCIKIGSSNLPRTKKRDKASLLQEQNAKTKMTFENITRNITPQRRFSASLSLSNGQLCKKRKHRHRQRRSARVVGSQSLLRKVASRGIRTSSAQRASTAVRGQRQKRGNDCRGGDCNGFSSRLDP